jgi:hypothetical protein
MKKNHLKKQALFIALCALMSTSLYASPVTSSLELVKAYLVDTTVGTIVALPKGINKELEQNAINKYLCKDYDSIDHVRYEWKNERYMLVNYNLHGNKLSAGEIFEDGKTHWGDYVYASEPYIDLSIKKNVRITDASFMKEKPVFSFSLKGSDGFVTLEEMEKVAVSPKAINEMVENICKTDPYFDPKITTKMEMVTDPSRKIKIGGHYEDFKYPVYNLTIDFSGQDFKSSRMMMLDLRKSTRNFGVLQAWD